jgi:regulator of cell morphogenesis and NO signaling
MSAFIELNPLLRRTVGDIAATLPGATAVFRRFKLDFCCGGDAVLAEAARQAGIDPERLLRELDVLAPSTDQPSSSRPTGELIEHILTRYHETHRREVPELIKLARKVEAVHAKHPKVPHGLADTLQQLLGEMEVHMRKEELILFPAMRRRIGSALDAPISQMRHDHDGHGVQLRKLQEMTGNFTVPEQACRSWQALYAGSAKLADDLMEHIHLENNVLFPRFEGKPPERDIVAESPQGAPSRVAQPQR